MTRNKPKYDDEPPEGEDLYPEEEDKEFYYEEPEEPIRYERELDRFTDWLCKE